MSFALASAAFVIAGCFLSLPDRTDYVSEDSGGGPPTDATALLDADADRAATPRTYREEVLADQPSARIFRSTTLPA